MIKYNFIKTLTAGFALALMFYPQARARDTGSCGPNCRYEYDSATKTLTYIGTGPNGSGEIGYTSKDYGLSGPVENAIISEGITRVYKGSKSTTIRDIGAQNGKLIIPSTLTSWDQWSSYLMGFGTIEINSKNLTFDEQSFRFRSNTDTKIIISADANINFDVEAFSNETYDGNHPNSITISCKGNPDACLEKFGNSLNSMTGTITPIYYQEIDSNKNVTLQYFDDGYRQLNEQGYYDVYDFADNHIGYSNLDGTEQYDEKGNIIAKYDTDGNLSGKYAYDAGGNIIASYDKDGNSTYKRTSYTPAEAVKAIKKGNNNKVTLTFK